MKLLKVDDNVKCCIIVDKIQAISLESNGISPINNTLRFFLDDKSSIYLTLTSEEKALEIYNETIKLLEENISSASVSH